MDIKLYAFQSDKFAEFVAFVERMGPVDGVFFRVTGSSVRVFAVLASNRGAVRITDGFITATDVTTAFPGAIALDCAVDMRSEDIESLLA
jgi:hypothetical protein